MNPDKNMLMQAIRKQYEKKQKKQREKKKHKGVLYVGNLDLEVEEDQLLKTFSAVGPVRSIHMTKDTITEQFLGYAYVTFKFAKDAECALNKLNCNPLNGRPMRIKFYNHGNYLYNYINGESSDGQKKEDAVNTTKQLTNPLKWHTPCLFEDTTDEVKDISDTLGSVTFNEPNLIRKDCCCKKLSYLINKEKSTECETNLSGFDQNKSKIEIKHENNLQKANTVYTTSKFGSKVVSFGKDTTAPGIFKIPKTQEVHHNKPRVSTSYPRNNYFTGPRIFYNSNKRFSQKQDHLVSKIGNNGKNLAGQWEITIVNEGNSKSKEMAGGHTGYKQ